MLVAKMTAFQPFPCVAKETWVKCVWVSHLNKSIRNHNGGSMLSPNTDAITSQVTSDYGVNNYLMAWAHTLLNTNLYPVSPKTAWFDGVAEELTTTKTKTQEWLIQDFPDIAAALPQTLISYANLFAPAVVELKPLLAKNPQGAERASVGELLDALHKAAVTHQWRVLGLQLKVKAFAKVAKESAAKMSANAK